MKPKFKVIEADDVDSRYGAFYTERSWAPDYLAKFECGEQKLPPPTAAYYGRSCCDDPVAIVAVRDDN